MAKAATISRAAARRAWLAAQRLDRPEPFGSGPAATREAVSHLGYVQIDTINVIERCHHHILWSRIPAYRRADLHVAQSGEKSVFEYWAHALAYLPAAEYRFAMPDMARHRRAPRPWFATVDPADLRKLLARIRRDGPLTIRDIDDDVLVEKDHAWASRKPSRRALQKAFLDGTLTVSARAGMLKTYELTGRHFGWDRPPRPATDRQATAWRLDRALRSQGVVSLDSACHLEAARKPAMRALIESRIRARALRPVRIEDAATEHWATPETIEVALAPEPGAEPTVHVLSPFDPLIIQRRRLALLFGYEHRFEAYVPKDKRVLGYFALPVLIGDEVVAAIDIKTDREARALRIQRWTWVGPGEPRRHKAAIEERLGAFERFQLGE